MISVLVVGTGGYIIPEKAIYTWYKTSIHCQLGDYMLPTIETFVSSQVLQNIDLINFWYIFEIFMDKIYG